MAASFLNHTCDSILINALGLIHSLCEDPRGRELLMHVDTASLVFPLLRAGDAQLRCNAAGALSVLADTGNLFDFYSLRDGIEAILDLLQSAHCHVVANGASLVRALSRTASYCRAFADCGTVHVT